MKVAKSIFVLLLACKTAPQAKPVASAPEQDAKGAMVTSSEKFNDFFVRSAQLEERLQESAARETQLLKPLALGLGLPDGATADDVAAALKKTSQDVTKAGARVKVAVAPTERPRVGVPSLEAKLANKGKALAPHPQLIFDTAVATLGQMIALRFELEQIQVEAAELKREAEGLTNEVMSTFAQGKGYRDAVVAELQARWKVLGDVAARAKTAADAVTASTMRLTASASGA